MSRFSRGQNALMISQRSGAAFPYNEMVQEWNGVWVHTSEFEPKQPQLSPRPVGSDPQALQHVNPARTEFYTPVVLANNPFTTIAGTTVTVTEGTHNRTTGDAIRFRNLSLGFGGVPVANVMPKSTLSAEASAVVTVLNVTSTAAFPSSGYAVISEGANTNETIKYTGKTGTTLTGCTRGSSAPSYGLTPLLTTASVHKAESIIYGSFLITVATINTYTFVLQTAATAISTGGGFPVFAGPVNTRA